MLMAIEMFSKAETKAFGMAMVAFVLSTIFLFLAIEGCCKLLALKDKPQQREYPRYEVDRNEFAEIGNAAIREQRMKSFIAETATGRTIEVTVDEILNEVKERKNARNDNA